VSAPVLPSAPPRQEWSGELLHSPPLMQWIPRNLPRRPGSTTVGPPKTGIMMACIGPSRARVQGWRQIAGDFHAMTAQRGIRRPPHPGAQSEAEFNRDRDGWNQEFDGFCPFC
jgi:hypothetical protein